MEQLIFFAVLIIFSILESVAKKRRQGGGSLPELPTDPESENQWPPPRRSHAEPPRTSVPPSYDDDASFDARLPSDEARSLETGASYDQRAAADRERRRRETSSESMIPADLWEEIAGLAREAEVERAQPTARPRPTPLPAPQQRRPPQRKDPAAKPPARARPAAAPMRTPPAPARRPDAPRRAEHPVHLAHAGFGTDPSARPASTAESLRPIAPAVHADARAVQERLRSQSASALRQAIILQEILGPPAALKPDRFEE